MDSGWYSLIPVLFVGYCYLSIRSAVVGDCCESNDADEREPPFPRTDREGLREVARLAQQPVVRRGLSVIRRIPK